MKLMLRELEQQVPGSVSLSSGGCNLCPACSRQRGVVCRSPETMRYSLDAFGFDLTAIAHDMLGIEIQWCKDRLPDYFTLVHGIASTEEITGRTWEVLNVPFDSDKCEEGLDKSASNR